MIILSDTLSLAPFLAVRLILVHVLVEFVVRNRILQDQAPHRLWRILGHAIMRALLVYTAASDWSNYWVPVIAFTASVIAELTRRNADTTWRRFIQRQVLYALSLLLVWIVSASPATPSVFQTLLGLWSDPRPWIVVLGYVLIIWPAGYLTGMFTTPWRESIQTNDTQGLQNAGLWIGRLERILIVTAILVDQFALIGFLVAAKSILRFADIQTSKNRQEAEYVLVGTLFSFTAAIAVGLITKATLAYIAALLAG